MLVDIKVDNPWLSNVGRQMTTIPGRGAIVTRQRVDVNPIKKEFDWVVIQLAMTAIRLPPLLLRQILLPVLF